MASITLQAFLNNQWIDIANVNFSDSEEQHLGITELHYTHDFSINYLDRDDNHAVSINHPVSLFFDDDGKRGWMKFLDDIVPSGASRRYWLRYLDINELTADQQNFVLLTYGTMSPVGNLRVKESLAEANPIAERVFFSIEDAINRAGDFLDYAQQRGAAVGGATGAGGEAPKLLLRCSQDDKIWIDNVQNDLTCRDTPYLVKFPRGRKAEIDCDIVRAEFHYYHELEAMGFNTISTQHMRLEEGAYYPSIWLPRFDISFKNSHTVKRVAMESVYSMLKKSPGTTLDQEITIRTLIEKISQSHMVKELGFNFDIHKFVTEWVRRDLLNIIFGNSDNHGGNTSFIRDTGTIELAPIYDFAPMKADPQGIPRTTKWAKHIEIGGEYNFKIVADSLSDLVPKKELMQALRETAEQLIGLKGRLQKRGVPQQIIEMPSIGFDYIADKLQRWGLL